MDRDYGEESARGGDYSVTRASKCANPFVLPWTPAHPMYGALLSGNPDCLVVEVAVRMLNPAKLPMQSHPGLLSPDVRVPSIPILQRQRPIRLPRAAMEWVARPSVTVAIAGALALAFAFLMPPFQFPDEHAHFARAYEISRGQFIGVPDPRLPSAVLAYLQRFPEGVRKSQRPRFKPAAFVPDLYAGWAGESAGWESIESGPGQKLLRWGAVATQIYSPIVYLPASAGIWIARELNLPPLAIMYAARLMSILSFLAALAACLRLAPDLRALTAAIALMPMTLHQAAAISADTVTIAISLVGFGLILRAREQPACRRYLAILFMVFPLWALCKTSIWALPLLLLIPSTQFGGNWKRAGYVLAAIIATVAAVALWRELSRHAFAGFVATASARGIDVPGNTHVLASHPLSFLRRLVTEVHYGYQSLISSFVGSFGWLEFSPPLWTCFALLTIPLAAGCVEWTRKPFTAAERTVLYLVAAGAAMGIYCMLFVVDGIYAGGRFSFLSAGVQGRYFIPFCLAGFLGLKQNAFTLKSQVLLSMVVPAATLYTLVCLGLVVKYYYL